MFGYSPALSTRVFPRFGSDIEAGWEARECQRLPGGVSAHRRGKEPTWLGDMALEVVEGADLGAGRRDHGGLRAGVVLGIAEFREAEGGDCARSREVASGLDDGRSKDVLLLFTMVSGRVNATRPGAQTYRVFRGVHVADVVDAASNDRNYDGGHRHEEQRSKLGR